MRWTWAPMAGPFRAAAETAAIGLVLGGLYWTSAHSYLLFHGLVESFSILVACGVFVVVWNSRRFWDHGYYLFLGISCLFVAAVDAVHTLAYKGMGVFEGGGSGLATQLWVVGRYLQSLSFLAATAFLRRKPPAYLTLAGFVAVTALALYAVFASHFPTCFVEGSGLTPFKKGSEFVICGFLAAAGGMLVLFRHRFDARVLALTLGSLAVLIASEVSFTRYVQVYGPANLIGHLLKFVSVYLLYKAILYTALAKPYDLLFRDLKRAETGLRKARDELEQRVTERTAELRRTVNRLEVEVRERLAAEERLARERRTLFSVLQMLPGFVALLGRDRVFRFVNDRFLDLFGDPNGRPCYEVLRGREGVCEPCPAQRTFQTAVASEWEWTSESEQVFHIWCYPFTDLDGERLVLELGIDITERRMLEAEVLRVSEIEKQRIGQDLHDSLGQILSGVSCLSQVLHRKLSGRALPEAEDAAKIESVLAESVSLTRSLARGLDPVGLQQGSLAAALGELAANVERMFGVRCVLQDDGPVMVGNAIVAKHLYRIAQEAANNAVRHGRAKRVSIALKDSAGQIVLTVRDDGVGLPEDAEQRGGLGLRIMRHRAQSINAELDLACGAEGGTVVTCRLRKAVSVRG